MSFPSVVEQVVQDHDILVAAVGSTGTKGSKRNIFLGASSP